MRYVALKKGPNGTVENIAITKTTSRNVTLNWTAVACESANGNITNYIVRYGATICNKALEFNVTVAGDKTEVTIDNLVPGQEYSFSVAAATAAGIGPLTDVLRTRTKEEGPNGTVENIAITKTTSRNVTLNWTAVACESANGNITNYIVRYGATICNKALAFNVTVAGYKTEVTIDNLVPGQEYSFSVAAATAAGMGPITDVLQTRTKEEGPNGTVENIAITKATSRNVTLNWTAVACESANGNITNYIVRYGATICNKVLEFNVTVSGNTTEVTIDNLVPGQEYSFSVAAATAAGMGPITDALRVRSNEEGPNGTVENLAIAQISSRNVTINWTPVACESGNGNITNYVVRYGATICNKVLVSNVKVAGNTTEVTIDNLVPGQEYSFSVAAATAAGMGPIKDAPGVRAKEEAPSGTATTLLITRQTSREVNLTWSPVECEKRNGDIKSYVIRYGAIICGNSSELNITVGGGATGTLVTDLVPGQNYSFNIAATTGAGDGPATTNLSVRTHEEAPSGKPRNLICNLENFNSVLLSWEPVSCGESNGVVSKYRIHWTKDGDPNAYDEKNVSAISEGKVTIEDLSASSDYVISVSGITSAGLSDSVSRCSISTTADPAVVAASTVVSVTVTFGGFVAVFIFYRRRRARPTNHETTTAMQIQTPISEPPVARKRPIKLSDLEERVRNMHQNSNFLFDNEYRDLRDLSPKHATLAAKLEGNIAKNRFVDILPFDHNRVRLLPSEDDDCSDFINASYMPGNRSRREYIAAQGPLPGTIEDFWQMIWEQNVPIIVMLTQLIEKGKRKCEQYWPEALNEPQRYGDITVTKNVELIKQDYTIRFLEMHLRDQVKTLIQCHYTTWPDHGCPQSTEVMLDFVKAVQMRKPKESFGPTLVHCSAGVGRTGTYICIDRLVNQLENQDRAKEVDIFGMVLDMRNFRSRIVQTEDQYVFIHDCVRDAVNYKRSSSFNESSEYMNFGGPSQASPDAWSS